MTIHIPVWFFYILGGAAALVILYFAAMGYILMRAYRDSARALSGWFGW